MLHHLNDSENVTVRNECVEAAVVVDIEKVHPEAHKTQAGVSTARRPQHVARLS